MTTTAPALKHELTWAYGFLIAAILFQLFLILILPGFVIALCVVGYAYFRDDAARGTVFASHLRWIARTFWIGVFCYLPLTVFIIFVLMAGLADYSVMTEAIGEGEKNAQQLMMLYMEKNQGLFTAASIGMIGLFIAWGLYRCLHGLVRLRKDQEIVKVTSWL